MANVGAFIDSRIIQPDSVDRARVKAVVREGCGCVESRGAYVFSIIQLNSQEVVEGEVCDRPSLVSAVRLACEVVTQASGCEHLGRTVGNHGEDGSPPRD